MAGQKNKWIAPVMTLCLNSSSRVETMHLVGSYHTNVVEARWERWEKTQRTLNWMRGTMN